MQVFSLEREQEWNPQRHVEKILGKVAGGEFFYVSSLSFKTVVYKGMLLTTQLREYYPDLSHPALESALAPWMAMPTGA